VCILPNALTDGVPNVPKGCSEGFWHFWHFIILGFRETHGPYTQCKRDEY
jgi:hypothetical protein